ncbi:MAG TPA: hypothetical protein VFQ45_22925 [Longimicrobium sp.]|nr:hypothetical protein [Longimicrobium sp.]
MRLFAVLAAAAASPYPAWAQGPAPPQRWTLVRDLRIGSQDRPSYTLSRVGDVAIGRNGDIYVAQPQEKVIRQFDARGAYVRTFGRGGAGPGEFQALERIGWKGDSLWAADPVQHRITFFDARGRVLQSTRAATEVIPGTGYPTGPAAALADGSLVGQPIPSTASIQQGTARTLPLLRMDRTGAVRGGFGPLEVRGHFEVIRRARLVMNMDVPLPFNSLWDAAPDGSGVVVVHRPIPAGAERTRFRVARYRPSGQVVFDRAYNFTPHPVSAASRDSIHDELAQFFLRTRFVQAAAQARSFARDSVPLPRFQPPVTDVTYGRDGTIWLGRERLGTRTVEYTVLGPDGAIIAVAAVPAGVRIVQAQRDAVWGVERDEMDVEYVVRFRVAPAR